MNYITSNQYQVFGFNNNKYTQGKANTIMKNNFKQRVLPDNFAEELLQLEIAYRLSAHPPESLLRKLIQFYSIGVQHYQSIKSHKYFYFSIKMKEIFNSLPNNQVCSQQAQREDGIQGTQESGDKDIKKNQLLRTLNDQMAINVNIQSVKLMVSCTKLKNFEAKRKVNQEIEKQNSRLLEKIQKRKKRAEQYKSFSTTSAGLTHHYQSDFSFQQQQELQKDKVQQKIYLLCSSDVSCKKQDDSMFPSDINQIKQ